MEMARGVWASQLPGVEATRRRGYGVRDALGRPHCAVLRHLRAHQVEEEAFPRVR